MCEEKVCQPKIADISSDLNEALNGQPPSEAYEIKIEGQKWLTLIQNAGDPTK